MSSFCEARRTDKFFTFVLLLWRPGGLSEKRMRKVVIGILLFVMVVMSGCTAKYLEIFPELIDPALSNKEIAVEKLREDVDALIAGIIERHPQIAGYTDPAMIYEQSEALKAEITVPMTRTVFFKHVGSLSYLFNDGHTFLLWPYQEYQGLTERGALTFPFALDIFPEGVFLKFDYQLNGELLAKGTQLISINDIAVKDIFAKTQKFVGGETETLRNHIVASRFPMMLWAVFGFVDEFKLTVNANGHLQSLYIEKNDRWQRADNSEKHIDDDFVYHQMDESTGYLKVATFDVSEDWFEDFIDQTFEDIKRQGIKNLIIDIRENGGGNTDTASYLAQHIAREPFRMISSMRERLNRDNRGLFNYRGEVGEILQEDWHEWIDPADGEKRFDGHTYVLISPMSYSSAIVFSTTVKDNDIATLVGRDTGGYANQTAQGNLFNLPNSELRVYVATRLLVRPNGNLRMGGVTPDISVKSSSRQIKAGIDADIEAVKQHIAGYKSST